MIVPAGYLISMRAALLVLPADPALEERQHPPADRLFYSAAQPAAILGRWGRELRMIRNRIADRDRPINDLWGVEVLRIYSIQPIAQDQHSTMVELYGGILGSGER